MQSFIHKAASQVTIYQGVRNMDPVHNLVTLPYNLTIIYWIRTGNAKTAKKWRYYSCLSAQIEKN